MTAENPDPFESTESYYADHRPEYGDSAIRHLTDTFGLDGASRVLDLGCGTGQITVPLAEHVGTVVAMDPNETMLRQARRRAGMAGVENIEWVIGSDSDIGDKLGKVQLTTMGRSFHWMDGVTTLEALYRLTESGGGVALLTDQEWLTKGTEGWQEIVYAIASEYVDSLPDRTGPVDEYDDPWDELLTDVGFADVETTRFGFDRQRSIDSIVGYVLSLSFCSPETLGTETEAFETHLRERLSAMDETAFSQTGTVEIISGQK